MRKGAMLLKIRNNRPITKEGDAIFFEKFETGLLLALKEAGFLDERQCENALKKTNNRG